MNQWGLERGNPQARNTQDDSSKPYADGYESILSELDETDVSVTLVELIRPVETDFWNKQFWSVVIRKAAERDLLCVNPIHPRSCALLKPANAIDLYVKAVLDFIDPYEDEDDED